MLSAVSQAENCGDAVEAWAAFHADQKVETAQAAPKRKLSADGQGEGRQKSGQCAGREGC
jgi:hypothetical protein